MRNAAIALTVILFLITLWIAKAFLVPILFGATIAALLSGLHLKLQKRMSSRWAALLLTVGATVLVILPLSIMVMSGVRVAAVQVKQFRSTIQQQAEPGSNMTEAIVQFPTVEKLIAKAAGFFRMDVEEVVTSAGQALQKGGLVLADLLGGFAQQLPQFTVELFLVLLAIFFTLVDGPLFSRFLRENSVFPPKETEEIMSSFHELCRSVMLATIASGGAQALTYLIGLVIVGSKAIPLITLLVFLGSFVPLFGASPITMGYALYLLLSGNTGDGVVLLIFAFVTGLVDNFVKPMVLKGAANMHPLIALVALFGGLEVFGFTGLFLGPIFVGLFLVTLSCLIRTRVTR